MNINALIEISMIFVIIVFIISIALLIYYSVKSKGLIEPIKFSGQSYEFSLKYKNIPKSEIIGIKNTIETIRVKWSSSVGKEIVAKHQNIHKSKSAETIQVNKIFPLLGHEVTMSKSAESVRISVFQSNEEEIVKCKNISKSKIVETRNATKTKHASEFSGEVAV
jgi:hypothetical protein